MTSPAPSWLRAHDVERAVRLLPGLTDARLTSWSASRLPGGAGACLGVWRLAGHAQVGDIPRSWSIVLKGWEGPATISPPDAWNWPHREMQLYRSGMLLDLPGGIRAPRYVGDVMRDDASVWVWLEDISDGIQAPWPIAEYGSIARSLGEFNGAWLLERPRLDSPILSRNMLSGWVSQSDRAFRAFTTNPALAHTSGVYPPDVLDAFSRLWHARRAFYSELAQLPQTFCHFDAFSRNIFLRRTPHEPAETILIDWSYAGRGAVGEEIAPLVAASVGFMDARIDDIDDLADIVLRGYLAGLADAGWHGHHEEVRRVFRISTALRYGIGSMQFALLGLVAPHSIPEIEQTFGYPFPEIMSNLAAFNRWVARHATV